MMNLQRLKVDFNEREDIDLIEVREDWNAAYQELSLGEKVILFDDEMEVAALLNRGTYCHYVGKIDRETIRDLSFAD
ncbi:hypothetical protein G6N74_17355 [Mesorhizobium sp. CGMCC 1.15528]|uniref:Uncharacterized protein n=1 Tax=Mesorhizobium zhangyense TaxID=1776730 RepID=A0A7C9R8J9_9HYPH|nr:hypothetical protein [Mesorhizobium zhangyense]NGN42840.1 hypothetical protein [Mesorhizobium zhangyense]